MPRWEPDTQLRLVRAALDLFAERGYDETTVVAIAERAGLTKSTFFRYFPDKRDVLAAGQDTLGRLLADGIAAAPPAATPIHAVAQGLDWAAGAFTADRRDLAPLIRTVVAGNAELRARAAQKHLGLAAAISDALRRRGIGEAVASVAAELGVLAFGRAYGRWSDAVGSADFAKLARQALDELHEAIRSL